MQSLLLPSIRLNKSTIDGANVLLMVHGLDHLLKCTSSTIALLPGFGQLLHSFINLFDDQLNSPKHVDLLLGAFKSDDFLIACLVLHNGANEYWWS